MDARAVLNGGPLPRTYARKLALRDGRYSKRGRCAIVSGAGVSPDAY